MQVLLIDRNSERLDHAMIGFMDAGMAATGTNGVPVAEACLRRSSVDVLVITADAAGGQTRALIHQAERRNRDVATILIAADVARASEIAAQSLPSVHCILSADAPAEQIVRFGLGSVRGTQITEPLPAASPASDWMSEPEPEPQPEPFVEPEPEPAAETSEHKPVFASKRSRGALRPTAYAA